MTSDDPVERLFALERFGIKLGLDNIRKLTAALGHPQHAYPTVHVAGTNGKGSVTAMVERALRAAGHRTGRYTSPHLSHIEERIAIDGNPVATEEFRQLTRDVLAVVDQLHREGTLETTPTFFEVTTAMAFEIFRRAGVQVAVIEVGLGGRFDATNVITPVAVAITSIALDHERHLGRSLAGIAAEKAGIIKPGAPVVVGEMAAEPREVIEDTAARAGAFLIPGGLDLVREVALTHGRATLSVVTPTREYNAVRLGLRGAHQIGNAVVAVRVLEECDAAGLRVTTGDIVCGLTDVSWPARLEWLGLRPAGELLLDAAHNPAGAEALAAYLRAREPALLPIVLAVMKDKDLQGIVRALRPVASRFVATSVAGERALEADALAGHIREMAGAIDVDAVPDPDDAVGVALSHSPRAVATGSFFFVGPLRARLVAAGAVSLLD